LLQQSVHRSYLLEIELVLCLVMVVGWWLGGI
jgi:hypothetical protein